MAGVLGAETQALHWDYSSFPNTQHWGHNPQIPQWGQSPSPNIHHWVQSFDNSSHRCGQSSNDRTPQWGQSSNRLPHQCGQSPDHSSQWQWQQSFSPETPQWGPTSSQSTVQFSTLNTHQTWANNNNNNKNNNKMDIPSNSGYIERRERGRSGSVDWDSMVDQVFTEEVREYVSTFYL